jgi:hypothetical protein
MKNTSSQKVLLMAVAPPGGVLSHPNTSQLWKLNQKRTNINKGLAFVAVYLLSLRSILRT